MTFAKFSITPLTEHFQVTVFKMNNDPLEKCFFAVDYATNISKCF